jgi:dTDP-4-amino-4,6-dideoxygalactose transaminase
MPIANLGATPVWCDVDPDTGMLNPSLLAARRTARTKAIIHYHWGGDVGPLGELQQVAANLGIPLIEDASGAFGAEFNGQKLGATGSDFTIYSFYAVSHLPAGDGGALFCRSAEHADRARKLRRFGIDQKIFRLPNGDLNPDSDIPISGYSMAMSDLTAALALAQFHEVEHTLASHRANGRQIAISTLHLPGITPLSRGDEQHSAYWVYAFRAAHREQLIARLQAAGIGAQRLHVRNDRYSCFQRSSASELPGVEIFDRVNLCVPCGWWVDEAALARILECLEKSE